MKSTELKAAGTLLWGRSVLDQFHHELELCGAANPVVLTIEACRRKALKAAAVLGRGGAHVTVAAEPASDTDYLILAGGKTLVDRWADDPRPKAWLILDDADLIDFREPLTDYIIADGRFIRSKAAAEAFLEQFARSISGGLAGHPGGLTIPPAFTYSCRTRVIYGDESLEMLPGLIGPSAGKTAMKKPMVLTDKGIAAAGILKRLRDVLIGTGFELFDEIPPDSDSLVVNRISGIYKECGCDGIIALGGGSVLDTGKGVLLNVSLGEDNLLSFVGSNRIPRLDTPFIAVPTTSGTGSEVTKVAVVSDAERHRKLLYVSPMLQPDYGILDSRLTSSLPPHLTSITGIDALSHAVEAYTCLGKNPVSDQMAWKAIELIRDNLIPLMNEPENLEMRRNLALASNLAGQAFSNSMVGMVHTIGHSIGAVCHAPHGSCMSVLLPYALEYNYPEINPLIAELLPAFAGEDAETVPPDERARETIACIRRLNADLRELTGGRHPTVLRNIVGRDGAALVSRTDFPLIARTSLGDASIVYNPVELRFDDIHRVLEESF